MDYVIADCSHQTNRGITLCLPIKDGPYFRFCGVHYLQGWLRLREEALQHLRSEMPETDCDCSFCEVLDPRAACQVCPECLEHEYWVRYANERPEEYTAMMDWEDEWWQEQRLKGE